MADKGQLTGYSGLTGFAVKRRLSYEKDSFVRTKFMTAKGIVLLKAGESYERPSMVKFIPS